MSELTVTQKKMLAMIYCKSLIDECTGLDDLAKELSLEREYVKRLVDKALQLKLLEEAGECYTLSEKGRSLIRVVMTGGAFDIIHPGHVYTLSACRRLGDLLVVSVARNQTVLANKGRPPINDEKERAMLVSSLKCVDVAVLGSKKDIFETVKRVRPDIIVIGYDQKHDERVVVEECRRRGMTVKVIRLDSPIPSIKSSKIVKDLEVLRDF